MQKSALLDIRDIKICVCDCVCVCVYVSQIFIIFQRQGCPGFQTKKNLSVSVTMSVSVSVSVSVTVSVWMWQRVTMLITKGARDFKKNGHTWLVKLSTSVSVSVSLSVSMSVSVTESVSVSVSVSVSASVSISVKKNIVYVCVCVCVYVCVCACVCVYVPQIVRMLTDKGAHPDIYDLQKNTTRAHSHLTQIFHTWHVSFIESFEASVISQIMPHTHTHKHTFSRDTNHMWFVTHDPPHAHTHEYRHTYSCVCVCVRRTHIFTWTQINHIWHTSWIESFKASVISRVTNAMLAMLAASINITHSRFFMKIVNQGFGITSSILKVCWFLVYDLKNRLQGCC